MSRFGVPSCPLHRVLTLPQKAAELIFDTAPVVGPSVTPRSPGPRRRMEALELDDSRQGEGQASRSRGQRVGPILTYTLRC
jgi:hypothetical protein